MRIVVVATSAVFMHMDAHRPMPSPPSASAHIVAAIEAAEHASMQPCIIDMSMPDMPAVSGIDMDFIMSAIMLIAARPLSSARGPWPVRRYAGGPRRRHGCTRSSRSEEDRVPGSDGVRERRPHPPLRGEQDRD